MKAVLLITLCTLLTVGLVPQTTAAQVIEPVSAYDAQIANRWFDLQRELVRETRGFTPPVASRAFAYTGVTLYEAVVGGMSGYQSLAGQLNELGELPKPSGDYHWGMVANAALMTITKRLFPTAPPENFVAIDALYDEIAAEFGGVEIGASAEYGTAVAEAIFAWSMTDGGHEGYRKNYPKDYVLPMGDAFWVQTSRPKGIPARAMQPYWGDNRSFLIEEENCILASPIEYSASPTSPFYQEAMEVYEVSNSLTAEQREIARFWADDPVRTATPPGHSISILAQVLESEGATLEKAAEAYAKLGIALADAFISCWQDKYRYNLLRPVTYIQTHIDADWTPFLTTPPFPEYPSGHSVQAGAAAEVFTAFFGEGYGFIDATHPGYAPRSFASFDDMAKEVAISRLYGGIHFRTAIEQGLEQGRCVGVRVNRLQFKQGES